MMMMMIVTMFWFKHAGDELGVYYSNGKHNLTIYAAQISRDCVWRFSLYEQMMAMTMMMMMMMIIMIIMIIIMIIIIIIDVDCCCCCCCCYFYYSLLLILNNWISLHKVPHITYFQMQKFNFQFYKEQLIQKLTI